MQICTIVFLGQTHDFIIVKITQLPTFSLQQIVKQLRNPNYFQHDLQVGTGRTTFHILGHKQFILNNILGKIYKM